MVSDLAYTFIDKAYVKNLFTKHAAAIRAMNMAVVSWMYRFKQGVPRLQFVGDLEVADSRTLPEKQFSITQPEKDLLLFLNAPQSSEAIGRHFGWTLEEVGRAVESLSARRLLFTDSARYLNLVCQECRLTHEDFERCYTSFVTQTSVGFE